MATRSCWECVKSTSYRYGSGVGRYLKIVKPAVLHWRWRYSGICLVLFSCTCSGTILPGVRRFDLFGRGKVLLGSFLHFSMIISNRHVRIKIVSTISTSSLDRESHHTASTRGLLKDSKYSTSRTIPGYLSVHPLGRIAAIHDASGPCTANQIQCWHQLPLVCEIGSYFGIGPKQIPRWRFLPDHAGGLGVDNQLCKIFTIKDPNTLSK